MNRIVFVIALILGMASGPQSQAELPLFQKMFLLHSIQIAAVVSPTDQYAYRGFCDKNIPQATDIGYNRTHILDQTLSDPQDAPFDVNFIAACDTPMTFNYANLIVPSNRDLAQFQLELGVIDNKNKEIHRVVVNAPCATIPTPGSPVGTTELVCTIAGNNGNGFITFVSQDQ